MAFGAILQHNAFKVKSAVAIFKATFGKFWLLFIPTSGHSGYDTV